MAEDSKRRLAEDAAADKLGAEQPKVSALAYPKRDSSSGERPMVLLTARDRDVEIAAFQPASTRTTGVMGQLRPNILHCIGGASLLALSKIAPGNGARILLKLESENPTGSMKDRMALAMIEAAEADGRLAAGGAGRGCAAGASVGRMGAPQGRA